jgi:hypothetical protein
MTLALRTLLSASKYLILKHSTKVSYIGGAKAGFRDQTRLLSKEALLKGSYLR